MSTRSLRLQTGVQYRAMQGSRVLLLLLPICAYAQPKYTIQDLGSLPNMPSCTGTAISQAGKVAGYCSPEGGSVFLGGATHGFLYAHGVLTDMGQTSKPTVPTGVNDSGEVVGAYVNINLATGISVAPFLFQNGNIQTYTGVPSNAAPFGLTNAGQAAATQISARGFNFFIASEAYLITGAGTST